MKIQKVKKQENGMDSENGVSNPTHVEPVHDNPVLPEPDVTGKPKEQCNVPLRRSSREKKETKRYIQEF